VNTVRGISLFVSGLLPVITGESTLLTGGWIWLNIIDQLLGSRLIRIGEVLDG